MDGVGAVSDRTDTAQSRSSHGRRKIAVTGRELPVKSIKKLFWIHYKLWNADLVRHLIRTRPRARRRPRGRISTFDFEDDDEHDDEDDVN